MSTPWRRRGIAVLATSLVIAAAVSCERQATHVLRLGHGLDTSHPVHQAMVRFGERTAELSNGEIDVRIFPAEQLGSERELLELLQVGSVALTKVSASVLGNFAPAFRLFGLPYLFVDDQHLLRVLDGAIGGELLEEPERFRLRGLTYYDAGKRSFYTTSKRVERPADLADLKIRTQESSMAMSMVQALGASPTPISWGELYSALQQGVVDGAENNPPSFHLSGHYEVATIYTLDEHTAVPDVLLISTTVWDALPDRHRETLLRAARESAILQRQLWSEATREALETVAAAGVEIVHPDKSAFRAEVEPLLEEARRDGELGPWLRRIDALAAPDPRDG